MSFDRSQYRKIVLRSALSQFFPPFPWTFFYSFSCRIDAGPDDVIIRSGGFLQVVRWLSVSSICRVDLVIRSSAQENRAGRQKQERWESLFCMNRFDFFPCRVDVKKLTTNWCRKRRCNDKEWRIPASVEGTICFFDLQIGFCYSLLWTGESGRQTEAKKVRVSFCM